MISKKAIVANMAKDLKDLLTIGYTLHSIGLDSYRNESGFTLARREHCIHLDSDDQIYGYLFSIEELNEWALEGLRQIAPHSFIVRDCELKEITDLEIYRKTQKLYYQCIWADRWRRPDGSSPITDDFNRKKLGKLTQKEIKELLEYIKNKMIVALDCIIKKEEK
jgi:hypothetical protein